MTYETIARLLFIADHPFTRWQESSTGEKAKYLTKAKRVLSGPGSHDYRVHALHQIIKDNNKEVGE